MAWRTYRASGVFLRAIHEALRLDLRITGAEHLNTTRPTLYVVNHFTRFETLMVPYAIFRATREPVRTLATHHLFKGALGRYLRACGVMSTRDPHRNRTILTQLMTGEVDWVIYPEGGLVKTKKTIDGRRLRLELPHRQGPPHTGAAVLALKSELCKRDYLRAIAKGDDAARERLEDRFGLSGAESVSPEPTQVVPVTLTYYPMRYGRRTFVRLARAARARLTPRAEEELLVEGTLLGDAEMSVHFGEPIDIATELPWTHEFARHVSAKLMSRSDEDYQLPRLARRLTDRFMRTIYTSVEVNTDHLVATALARCPEREIGVQRLRFATYLAGAWALGSKHRTHPRLGEGLAALATGERHEGFEKALQLAEQEGVVARNGDRCTIDTARLHGEIDFHDMRLNNMTRVIANECEALTGLSDSIARFMRLPMTRLRSDVARTAQQRDRSAYHDAHARLGERDRAIGEPFILTPKRPRAGVVLVHGYLSAPSEMRDLAEHLRDAGHLVYATRLHGHGTSPEELREVSWLHWLDSIRRGVAAASASCDRVVIGGNSLGGILALLAAAAQGAQIAGVFTINAPLRLRDRRAPLSSLATWGDAVLKRFGLQPIEFSRSNRHSESPDINYARDYLRGLAELRRAIGACKRQLRSVVAPALIIQGERDPVVHPSSGRLIHDMIASARREFVPLPFDRHIIVRGEGAESVFDRVATFVDSVAAPADETA